MPSSFLTPRKRIRVFRLPPSLDYSVSGIRPPSLDVIGYHVYGDIDSADNALFWKVLWLNLPR
jgi:hypothetical protein